MHPVPVLIFTACLSRSHQGYSAAPRAIPTELLFTVTFLLHICQRGNGLLSRCLPWGAGAPGSAWKVSGSTGHPLLAPQPLWTTVTTSIPGLWETEDMAGLRWGDNDKNGHIPIMWRWLMQPNFSMVLKT